MMRTLAILAALVVGAVLVASPAEAKCPKPCTHLIVGLSKTCKTGCPKKKAGKSCRSTCAHDLTANKLACKRAPNPTPPDCGLPTTTTTSTTTTIPCTRQTSTAVKGALPATLGHFTYNATPGIPGADAACNSNFTGSHACTLAQLQSAPATDLACLKDTTGMPVTSFWAIDSMAAPLAQCNDDVVTHQNWEYQTAHTMSRGQRVTLDNAAGTLGSLETGLQCNAAPNWVGCCQ
jgi:hypothetical protein